MEIHIGMEDVSPLFCSPCASLLFGTWYDGSEVTRQFSCLISFKAAENVSW